MRNHLVLMVLVCTVFADCANVRAAEAGAGEDATTRGEPFTSRTCTKTREMKPGRVRVLPSGTKIPIVLKNSIDSDTSHDGDIFDGKVLEDLSVDGGIIIPAGTVIQGHVDILKPLHPVKGSKAIHLGFDSIVDRNMHLVPLHAEVVVHSGVLHTKRGLKDIAIATYIEPFVKPGCGIPPQNSEVPILEFDNTGFKRCPILLAKPAGKIELRSGDECKFEMCEDLSLPDADEPVIDP